MFGLGKRALEDKFTKSEMALLGWRSHEMSFHMQQQSDEATGGEFSTNAPKKKQRKYRPGEIPDGLPDEFFNEEGELDLRQVTGAQAYKLFQKMGIKLPVIRL